jgi:hypothetical protein
MSTSNPLLIKPAVPGAAISPYRVCKWGGADNTAIQATASTDILIGVSNELGAASGDAAVDLVRIGVAEVELGAGGIARGQPVTSDSAGKGVHANPGAGANAYVIGYAERSGNAGDIVPVLLAPGRIQG